jgi:hypothetical protein
LRLIRGGRGLLDGIDRMSEPGRHGHSLDWRPQQPRDARLHVDPVGSRKESDKQRSGRTTP